MHSLHLPHFCLQVLRDFSRNRGLLLAGAIAYNSLLSLIPLLAVLLVAASHFFAPEMLVSIITAELEMLVPGQSANTLMQDFASVIENRALIGSLGALVLIFFSSLAFRTLEDALAVIFAHEKKSRSLLISALLPFVFIFLLAIGLLMLTWMDVTIQAISARGIRVLGENISAEVASSWLLNVGGFVGLTILFSAIYWIMPTANVSLRLALVGGATATLLWEAVRRLLVFYFSNLSMVNKIYGSAAAIVIILLTLEIGSIILLLGAQVIANLEKQKTTT